MKATTLAVACLMFASTAGAACRWEWVDHDHNTFTPPVQKQLCDNSIDPPAIRQPSIAPIQQPGIKPIEQPTIPPVGTQQCRTESVHENGQWVNKQVCR